MTDFIEIINTYTTNYSSYQVGLVEFECKYGELTFYKSNTPIIIIHAIYVLPDYRQTGLCKNVFQYCIDSAPRQFKKLCVQSVMSKVLYAYLLRFSYKNRRFRLNKYGFECRL